MAAPDRRLQFCVGEGSDGIGCLVGGIGHHVYAASRIDQNAAQSRRILCRCIEANARCLQRVKQCHQPIPELLVAKQLPQRHVIRLFDESLHLHEQGFKPDPRLLKRLVAPLELIHHPHGVLLEQPQGGRRDVGRLCQVG